ncbi:MAG: ribosomal-processing cysteine protease Prp [Oscillospiraceae bacterium]|jgi:uncharacterized protein YsxB (DUF464 family)|nr:ribosomal-processing cysteine protease Prp [Oscillospiraceae bacterium]
MISIKVFVTPEGNILGFELFGHSGYEEVGKDIVCAAVSSVLYMVVNTLSDVLNVNFEVLTMDNKDAYFKFIINNKDFYICKFFMIGLKNHFLNLEEQYYKNIKVSYVEVQNND